MFGPFDFVKIKNVKMGQLFYFVSLILSSFCPQWRITRSHPNLSELIRLSPQKWEDRRNSDIPPIDYVFKVTPFREHVNYKKKCRLFIQKTTTNRSEK